MVARMSVRFPVKRQRLAAIAFRLSAAGHTVTLRTSSLGRVAHLLNVLFGGTISTEGAPSLRFWQGWDAMLLEPFHCYDSRPDQTTCASISDSRPLAKNAKDEPLTRPDDSEIRSLGHPALLSQQLLRLPQLPNDGQAKAASSPGYRPASECQ